MADGYARVTGKPGVAFVITGPCLTNSLTAMAQSREDSVAVLVILGVNRRDSLGRGLGRLHELPDQVALVRALCPSRQTTDPQDLGPTLDWAFDLLTTGRPGPVHIEVPTDVMPLPCDALPKPAAPAAKVVLPAPALTQAVTLLNAAKRPVILAGGGVRGTEAGLLALALRLNAPVIQTTNARGIMHGHPLCIPASPSLLPVRALIAASDQIFAIGTEIGQTDYDMYADDGLPSLAGMICTDIDADQLARHPAALPLQGDAGATMAALTPQLAQKLAHSTQAASDTRIAGRAALADLSATMPAQLEMVEAIRSALPQALIMGDSTQPVYAGNLY